MEDNKFGLEVLAVNSSEYDVAKDGTDWIQPSVLSVPARRF